MEYQKINKFSFWNPPTQKKSSLFTPRPFTVQGKQDTQEPLTQQDIENAAFNQKKYEAFGLQLKEKNGKITPLEQERLGVLQAKMTDFWAQRKERAKGMSNLIDIPTRNPETTQSNQPTVPVQPKLTIGQPNDKYEHEADQVAAQVVEQIHSPNPMTSTGAGVQRQEMTEEKAAQTKPDTVTVQQNGGGVMQRMQVRGQKKQSEVSSTTAQKHVVAQAAQPAQAQANYGDSTFVLSKQVLTNAVDANAYNFTEQSGAKSQRYDIQAKVVIYQYEKTGDPPSGLAKNQPVALTIDGVATLCEIGVKKGGDDKLKITHFKKL
ncbi:MAG: hypothetical protein RIM23_21045 [Coleofasciculus sp. G3-WIS-01]|uniref:hypothetical protein n=1 Tax=Coleofasciculus sp. G3-WIS-01 TaxID=3069528 RepID=UPI003304EFD4